MNIFISLTAGDSSDWFDGPQKHPQRDALLTSADWALTYQLRGPSALSIVATREGAGWRSTMEASASAQLVPGAYLFVAQLTRAGERLTVGKGSVTILADLAAVASAIDARTLAEKALFDCEAALASFKSSGGKVKSYTIGTRTTEFHSLTELMALRSFWQRRVNKERGQSAKSNGRSNPRALLVSFG